MGIKMFQPVVLTRMKQSRNQAGCWVDPRQIWSLFQIASPTGKCKVVDACRSAVLPGDNLFDVIRGGTPLVAGGNIRNDRRRAAEPPRLAQSSRLL
jgi:hypothetical protein